MIAPVIQSVLDTAAVPYCLIGAHALAVHGVARYTADVDFLTMQSAVLSPSHWPAELQAMIRHGDASDPLAGVVRFDHPPVDLIVGRGRLMAEAVKTSVHVPLVACRVVTIEALALLKLEAGGLQDLSDLQLLFAARALDGENLQTIIEARLESLSAWGRRSWEKLLARLEHER